MFILLTLLISSLQDATSTLLPSYHLAAPGAEARSALLDSTSKWRVQVGDTVYHAPEAVSELSPSIENYYYAMGSQTALTHEMKAHRVGGEGRWHIFHLPNRQASLLQTMADATMGDRRSSISTLQRLKSGTKLSQKFPEYVRTTGYKSPLSKAGQAIEKKAVAFVTSDAYMKHLQEVTALGTRSFYNHSASQRASGFLVDQFKSMGYATCIQKSTRRSNELYNVIAYVPGQVTDAVVVGAHYDSRPFTGRAPGAEDNGSGVAGLLAIANAFMKAKVKTHKSVYFVGFGGEEPGLLGSRAFAHDFDKGGGSIPEECLPPSGSLIELKQGVRKKASLAAIVMDEIGWLSPSFPKPTVNLESYDWSSDIMDHMVNSCHDHNGDTLSVVHNNAPFGSDHMSFLEKKMPSVLTINGDDEAYPHYHQSSDTIDNVNATYGAQIAKMNMGALVRLAGVSHRAESLLSKKKLRASAVARHSA